MHPASSPERGHASSSSGADLLELEPSAGTHLPPTITHAFEWNVQTASSPRATLGLKRLPVEAKWNQMEPNGRSRASLQMSCRASLLLLFVPTHCPDRLWNRPADDPPPATPTPPPALITADSLFALRFHTEDKRICGSQTKSSNQNCVLRSVTIVQPFN